MSGPSGPAPADQTPEAHLRWANLPITDHLLSQKTDRPLEEPAESVAERLLILLHLTFNAEVWGSGTGRIKTYWTALGARVESATANPTVAAWWCDAVQAIAGLPIRRPGVLAEKNRLVRPTHLDPPVADEDVLDVFRVYTLDLVDRTREWNIDRRATQADTEVDT